MSEPESYFISHNQTVLDDGTVSIPARVAEGSNVVVNRSGDGSGTTAGSTQVAQARILLDKLADIRYTDEISFTNELGQTITRKPKEINVKRMLSGKPVLTEIFI
ncbi:hypothetical protein [Alteribacter populi]|uniref:hypothetical protein n=1 Tax=Alteribacter populi TaxID=2011011 RepID=UPI001FE15E83|nr:hypothetical protein [Alteribacter populi]